MADCTDAGAAIRTNVYCVANRVIQADLAGGAFETYRYKADNNYVSKFAFTTSNGVVVTNYVNDEQQFEWDEGNVGHLARHGVSPREGKQAILDPDAAMLEIQMLEIQ
jgi:hypothetical protein